MVKLRNIKPGDVIWQRSRSVRLGPSAIKIEVLEVHADYALVRRGTDQPPERIYRKYLERLHKTPFPVPGGGRITQDFGGPSSIRALRDRSRVFNERYPEEATF